MLALDPIASFAHMAFALEAIAPCLEASHGNTTSERLKVFAVGLVALEALVWQRVGRLRHALFHGGIQESSAVPQDAEWCAHVAGYVLVAALRHVLNLEETALPALHQLQLSQMRDLTATSDGFIRPSPPETMW
jgi:hypothetical protein